jgi:hypothetical protein
MSDFFSGLKRLLTGGALDQLPVDPPAREDFGLSGAQVQGSDLADQLRNTERKEAAVPRLKGAVNWKKYLNLALTENPAEAGFIRPDGTLVSLAAKDASAAKRFAEETGTMGSARGLTHSEAAGGPAAMQELVSHGHIRYKPEAGGFDLGGPPGPKQVEQMRKLIEIARKKGQISLDLKNGLGAPEMKSFGGLPEASYGRPAGAYSRSFPSSTSADDILAEIENFYGGY